MKKAVRLLVILVLGLIVLASSLLIWLTVTDYKPNKVESLRIEKSATLDISSTFTILNWNIGYGGLGKDSDFFFDGGDTVIIPEEKYNSYIDGITGFINDVDADIYYVQEVDRNSKRSYNDNQYSKIAQYLPGYDSVFAKNYDVAYIPSPALFKPAYGKVEAGLATFSRYKMERSDRFSLPGNYKWPRSVMFLDRCMIVTRIATEDNRYVVLINTHNSAYDKGGFIKQNQLKFIKEFAEKEYSAGNYVIIGGDWNSYMPGTDGETYKSIEEPSVYNEGFPSNWDIEGWNWGTDASTPSSRSLKTPYVEGDNFCCLIDGYLLSPNIEIKSIKTYDLGFKFSDHNPVEITVELK